MKYRNIRFIAYISLCIVIFFLSDKPDALPSLGGLLLFTSLDNLICYKNNGILYMLMVIFGITNLALAYGCFFLYEDNVYSWQVNIVNTFGHVTTAKALTLFYLTMSIGIMKYCRCQRNKPANILPQIRNVDWHIGKMSMLFGYGAMLLILIFLFNRDVTEYTTGKSALYEYVIVIFLLLYLYMPYGKIYKFMMLGFSCLYILQGLLFGDRSSAFPMIILVYILLQKAYKPLQFVFLALAGVLGANLIGLYRRTFVMSSDLWEEVANRFFYVDSISYSFWAGVQIIRATSAIVNKFDFFCEWVMRQFLGGTKQADVSNFVKEFSDAFYNGGGGLTSSTFYFFGGFIGVIVGGLVIGLIIGKVFSKEDKFYPFMQIIIVVYCLRWYSYYPSAFFRTCVIIPFFFYYAIRFYSKTFVTRNQ